MTFSQTIVIGNLGRDPELRYLQDGTALATFSIAHTEKWGSGENRQSRTTWYNVSVFGDLAETVTQYLAKGRQAMVIGQVEARLYTNNSGEAAVSLDLRAREVKFLGSRQDAGDSEPAAERGRDRGGDDSIPF